MIVELLMVSLIALLFLFEIVNGLDYIQGTRLALINMVPEVAAILMLMSLMRRKFQERSKISFYRFFKLYFCTQNGHFSFTNGRVGLTSSKMKSLSTRNPIQFKGA